MDSSILERTQAFITEQREALLKQREGIFTQQQELQGKLDAVNEMLAKFDVFEGKRAAPATRRSSGTRRGSKRDELLAIIKSGNGLARADILSTMGVKGNKQAEMSVSNALTALTKGNQIARRDGKYYAA